MKKILVTSIISLIILNMAACTKLLQLRKNISEDVISSIKVNQIPVAYEFTSDIPEMIKEYTVSSASLDIKFNSYFKSNIDEYMRNKFTNMKIERNGYFILFKVKKVNFERNYNGDFSSAFMGGLMQDRDPVLGHADFSCKIITNVTLYQNNILLADKEIISDSNYSITVKESNKSSYDYEAYQKATDMNISKSLILINKYLSSINM